MLRDYRNKAVVITGGTRGIGLATGLVFARHGAHCYLTHRWGSADEDAIRAKFAAVDGLEPVIVEADVSRKADTKALMDVVAEQHDGIEMLLANVCVVMRGDGVDSHSRRALLKSLDYSAWPLIGYLKAIKERFGTYPRYVVASSSDGPDTHYPGYDYVAIAKSVLETFVRYMADQLQPEGVRVNALRSRMVMTESYQQIFGDKQVELANRFPELIVTPEDVANTTLAMCSGLLDGMSGQVVVLDRGASYVDNLMTLGQRMGM